MRAFVAVSLPRPLVAELGALARELDGSLPAARWVRDEGLHLTLAFLGEVSGEQAEALAREMGPRLAGLAPPLARVGGGGTFPPERPARVAWVGFDGGGELAALREEVAAAAESAAGWRRERRPFHAHVTLARPRRPWSPAAAERFRRAVPERLGEPFRVEGVDVLHSRLGRGGARYELLHHVPLGEASVADDEAGEEG